MNYITSPAVYKYTYRYTYMQNSETDSTSSSIISASFFGRFPSRRLIAITSSARTFTRTLKQSTSNMSVQDLQKSLAESVAREENMRKELDELKNYIKSLKIKPEPSAPTEDEIVAETSKITYARRREIQDLLLEIRFFDGTSDVEAFLTQCRRINKQMTTDAEKVTFINKVIASRLGGEAAVVAERITDITPKDFAEAMRLAFGKTEKDYSQLIEERNAMRQGFNERVENFIKRYGDVDRRIQRSIDQEDPEFREVYRRIESKERIARFLRALKPEIKAIVMTRSPKFINDAYQYALYEEKIYRDDELLRSRQKSRYDEPGKRLNESIAPGTRDSKDPKTRSFAPGKDFYCESCKMRGHTEDRCFRKYPELRNANFRKGEYGSKDPPRKIHESQESYITPQQPEPSEMDPPDSTERIQFCSRDFSVRQRQMDSW